MTAEVHLYHFLFQNQSEYPILVYSSVLNSISHSCCCQPTMKLIVGPSLNSPNTPPIFLSPLTDVPSTSYFYELQLFIFFSPVCFIVVCLMYVLVWIQFLIAPLGKNKIIVIEFKLKEMKYLHDCVLELHLAYWRLC